MLIQNSNSAFVDGLELFWFLLTNPKVIFLKKSSYMILISDLGL